MERNIITRETGSITVTGSNIWMTVDEIADLFNVCGAQVSRAIRKLIKQGMFDEYAIDKSIPVEGRPGCTMPIYGIDVVIALAFQWENVFTHLFREWLAKKATATDKKEKIVLVHYENGSVN